MPLTRNPQEPLLFPFSPMNVGQRDRNLIDFLVSQSARSLLIPDDNPLPKQSFPFVKLPPLPQPLSLLADVDVTRPLPEKPVSSTPLTLPGIGPSLLADFTKGISPKSPLTAPPAYSEHALQKPIDPYADTNPNAANSQSQAMPDVTSEIRDSDGKFIRDFVDWTITTFADNPRYLASWLAGVSPEEDSDIEYTKDSEGREMRLWRSLKNSTGYHRMLKEYKKKNYPGVADGGYGHLESYAENFELFGLSFNPANFQVGGFY